MSKTRERKSSLTVVSREEFESAVVAAALQSWEPPSTISATLTWQPSAGRPPTQVSVAVSLPTGGTTEEITWQNPGAAPVDITATGTFQNPATSGNTLRVTISFPGSPAPSLAIVYENSMISTADLSPQLSGI